MALGIGAFFLTTFLLKDDDGGSAGGTGTNATESTDLGGSLPGGTGAGTTTTAESTTIPAGGCDAVAQDAAAAARAVIEEWDGYQVKDLAVLARSDPAALPGLRRFFLAAEQAVADGAAAGCDPGSLELAFDEGLDPLSPTGPGQAVLAALRGRGLGFGGEDLGGWGLTAALTAYPQPVAPPVTGGELSTPTWVVILESLETGTTTREQAGRVAEGYRRLGLPVDVLLSDDYASLRAGYWAVYVGFWDRLADADAYCASIRASAEGCYGRFLQVHPGAAEPGRCGEHGRYMVTGLSAGQTLPVRGHPGSSYPVIGSLDDTAVGVLVTGDVERRQSIDWTPVVAGPASLGWVDGAFLEPDPSCLLPEGTSSLATCAAVAEAGVDVAGAVLEALAGLAPDQILGVAPEGVAALENHAGELAARGADLDCGTALAAAVRAAADGLSARGQVALLVREFMRIDGVFGS